MVLYPMTDTQRHTKYMKSTQEYIIAKMENTVYEKYSYTLKSKTKLQGGEKHL